ncbi:hypothetical protein [Salinarimonas soli]|uniref:Uncharacterized protein n=1 Tax=Salinarimonas soli TaxID=1638099 RepID=A0A5B2VA27_9HYPH|nr:hypothetical protein [Salinarimonas soli]KAA2235844.1 hypothetical protein F0L46_17520 [Salinarimonas soli]
MSNPLETALNATRIILDTIDQRDRVLEERERILHDELTGIANERRSLAADKDTLIKAEAIRARFLPGVMFPVPPTVRRSEEANSAYTDAVRVQSRARVGNKRYAMLATLRDVGSLTLTELAIRTKLSAGRVREQMRADSPVYVRFGAFGGHEAVTLTEEGHSLLERFEKYRREADKPLPSLTAGEDGSDDEEIDPAHSRSDEAGVQGQGSAPVKPSEEVGHEKINL